MNRRETDSPASYADARHDAEKSAKTPAAHAATSRAEATAAKPSTEEAPFSPEQPFFTNRDCPYFPCHEGIDLERFNCLFCYCPLYALGPRCGGNFSYTEKGAKDCSRCTLTHNGNEGNRLVNERFAMLAELAAAPKNSLC